MIMGMVNGSIVKAEWIIHNLRFTYIHTYIHTYVCSA